MAFFPAQACRAGSSESQRGWQEAMPCEFGLNDGSRPYSTCSAFKAYPVLPHESSGFRRKAGASHVKCLPGLLSEKFRQQNRKGRLGAHYEGRILPGRPEERFLVSEYHFCYSLKYL